jgi:uncharacterized protein (TIGR02271 family)
MWQPFEGIISLVRGIFGQTSELRSVNGTTKAASEGTSSEKRRGSGEDVELSSHDRSRDRQVARLVEDEAVLPLLTEELSVERRRVETGRLQVRRVTREELKAVDEELVREEAELERVPIGQIVEARPPIRETEDELVIPVIEEVLVRRLMLKEEVHIRKKRTTEHHREQVSLRTHEALIERLPPREPVAEERDS